MGTGVAVRIPWWLGLAAAAAVTACRPEAGPPVAERTSSSLPPGPTGAPAPGSSAPAPGASAGPIVTASAPARFAFDFEDADLPALVRLVGGITGKRFILSGPLPAVHATVHSPEPVTAEEAYQAFLAILQSNGLTVVQAGPFGKIMASPGR